MSYSCKLNLLFGEYSGKARFHVRGRYFTLREEPKLRKEFSMKNLKTSGMSFATAKLKAIIALAIIAVIGFSMLGCIINVPDDNNGGGDTPNTSLNGSWKRDHGNGGVTFIEISGNTGYCTKINNIDAAWQSAINLGYYKIGNPVYNNIKKSGDWTWTCQELHVYRNSSNVATGTVWLDCTFTMNSNG
jgi:hypothetical protein